MPTLEFEKTATQNGFDYYAVWDGQNWLNDTWVRVPEGASLQAVEDALYRNDTVSSL